MSRYKGYNPGRDILLEAFSKKDYDQLTIIAKNDINIDFMLRMNIRFYNPPTYQKHEYYLNVYKKLCKIYEH